jgi:lipopolysaccharide cholinephosphotransferase
VTELAEVMYSLEDIQAVNTKLLIEFDRVCRILGIPYFLDSGTLLGAVRHRGHILWDDDTDVAMWRKDYERFLQEGVRQLGESFEFSLPDDYGERAFYDFVPHLLYKPSVAGKTDAKQEFYRGKLNHILLDVFILDDLPQSRLARKMRVLRLKFIYGLSWGHRFKIDYSDYSTLQKPTVFVLSHIGKLFKQSTLTRWYWNAARGKAKPEATYCACSNYIIPEIGLLYEKSWFTSTVEVDFEGLRFLAPVGYHEILSSMYGDYMKWPPEGKRHPTHLNLDDPYLKLG